MNHRRVNMGDTWRVLRGSRRGIRVRKQRLSDVGAATPVDVASTYAKKSAKKTGYYMEPGPWVYRWDARSANIMIVLTPTSTQRKSLARGSKAWSAILNAVATGKAKKIEAETVIKLEKRIRAEAKAAPTERVVTYSDDASNDADVLAKQAGIMGDLPDWWPWAAGGVAAAIGAILLLGRRR